jgi:plastocyanin
MNIRNFIYASLMALGLAALGCGSSSRSTTSTATSGGTTAATTGSTGVATRSQEVSAHGTSFSPAAVTVTSGLTVTWTNTDVIDHTVTSGKPGLPNGMFDQLLHPGQTFTFTFSQAGTFPYYCRFHFTMGMVGSVTVQAAGGGAGVGNSGP